MIPSRYKARFVLVALLLLVLLGLTPSSVSEGRRLPPPGSGDAVLHLATVGRIRAGESYYQAAGHELRSRNYPTARVFNWRTPAHLLAVAILSVPAATVLLKILAFGALLLTPIALARESVGTVLVGLAAQLGALATAFRPLAVGIAEVWAGVFIALSLCAYLTNRRVSGAVLGLAALFTRELAAPYCLACGLIAITERRRRESCLWLFGAAAYGVYFAAHAMQVWTYRLPGDLAHAESWVRWNGLRFVLDTAQVNGWVAFLPRWGAVLFVALALSGVAARAMPRHVAAPLVAYFLAFAVVGQPFNYYWGFVTAPIWALAAAHGVEGLRELVRASWPSPVAAGGSGMSYSRQQQMAKLS